MKTHLHKTNIFFKFINCLKNIKFSLTYHRAVTPEPVWGRRYLSNQQDCHTPFYIPLDRRKPPRLQNGVKKQHCTNILRDRGVIHTFTYGSCLPGYRALLIIPGKIIINNGKSLR